jgi:protease-4
MRALLLLLLPALASAQTGALVEPPQPSRGVTLPPTSPALAEDATALAVNPAGLRFMGPGQLFYLHERNLVRDQVGDGLFLGTTVLGVGAGLSVEWVRGHALPDYRKTAFGLALGSEKLSLGVAFNHFASEDAQLDRLSSVDLGLTARPARFLSLGAVVKDVNAPAVEGLALPRRWDVAVGVRPLGERWTLGADYAFTERALGEGRLTWTLRAAVLPGFGLGAGFSHGLTGREPPALQVAATFDTSRLGVTYAGGGAEGRLDHVVAVRLSSQPYPALRFGQGVVALVDLDDRLVPQTNTGLSLLGVRGTDPFLKLMRWLDEAARDPRLAGVVLKVSDLPGVNWGQAEELRQAVLRLRAADKKVLAVLLNVDDRAYFVASAADQVYALPGASLVINGLSASVTYLGGTMGKLGVTWDVARVGEYKTAPEQLTRTDMSAAQRETLNAWLDTQASHYETVVAGARKLPVERVREAWGIGLLSASRAQALGLVDGVLLQEELEGKLQALMPGARYAPEYAPRDTRDSRWTSNRRIAVVPVLGSISGGKSRDTPLGSGSVAGAETVMRALEQARNDPSVVAIVLRVDSPGGEVLASEQMYRAVLEAKKSKPVIASMGDVAASGGYYAAMGAHEIHASPTTLTGSIGVFYLKPALRGLGERLGVSQETMTRGPHADLLDSWRPWTPEEQQQVQGWVDEAYDDFITQVAQSRGLDKARVDAVARGRVWSGKDARERGLVDSLGGLMEAVAAARRRAGVPASEGVDLVVLGEPRGLLASLGGEPGVLELLPPTPPALPPAVQGLVREAGLDSPAVLEPGLKALLPFSLSVH